MTASAPNTICLCSGGIDSTLVLGMLLRRGVPCTALFIDYGQAARAREQRAVGEVARHYGVELGARQISVWQEADSGLLRGIGASFLLHRNLQLLLVADVVAQERGADTLAMGLCRSSTYPDSSRAFVAVAQQCLTVSHGKTRTLLAPLLDLDKPSIGRAAGDVQAPLELTFSCHRSGTEPCGACEGCVDRSLAEGGFREAGTR